MPEEAQETKRDLISAAKQLPVTGNFSLRPRNFEEAYRFANLIAESDLIPREFQKKPANVLIAVQLGMELGVSPMQALQSIYVVNGRPAIFGDLLPAIIFQSGLLESIHEEGDDKAASCTVKRKGHEPITRTFTIEDAKRVTMTENGKQITLAEKQTYKSYPKRMLQMRARAFALRDMFPDVLKGVAVREEVEDYAEPVDITPSPEPLKTPQPLEKKADDEKTARSQQADQDTKKSESHTKKSAASELEPDRPANGSNEPVGQPSPEDIALAAIDGYQKESWPDAEVLKDLIKDIDDKGKVRVCRYFDMRKREVLGA